MEERTVELETAVLAKELGFNQIAEKVYVETLEHTIGIGRGEEYTFSKIPSRVLNRGKFDEWEIVHCDAPTQSLLQKYLREVYGILVYVDETGRPHIRDEKSNMLAEVCDNGKYAGFEYEDALERGLIEGLKVAGKRK